MSKLEGYLDVDDQFSRRWLLEILERKSERYRKLAGFKSLKEITSDVLSEDQGYMSRVYVIKLVYEDEDIKLCLKVPSLTKVKRIFDLGANAGVFEEKEKKDSGPVQELQKIKSLHNNECRFYESAHKIKGLKVPQVYSTEIITSDPSMLPHILMDFCDNGRIITIEEALSRTHLEKAADQIALLHAHFIGNNITAGAELFEAYDHEKEFPKEQREQFGQFIKFKVESTGDQELVQKVEECHKYFGNDDFMTYAGEKAHLELGIEPVISHGDMWANNIIFETDKDNNLTGNVVGIIDWQLVNFGNPAQDLARLLVLNCDPDLRRELSEEIFHFYHAKLVNYLQVYGKSAPFNVEQVIKASKSQILVQAAMSLFFIAFHFEGDQKKEDLVRYLRRVKPILDDVPLLGQRHFPRFFHPLDGLN